MDKLGDIFEEVTKDGPALVQQLGEELSKARETVTRISEKLTNGEGQQVLAELAGEVQQKLDKIATEAKRDAAEAEQKLARIAAEAKQKAEGIERELERKKNEFRDRASRAWNSVFG